MPSNKPRFTVVCDEELLKKIDDFRFENRYNSRTSAAIELINRGLEAVKNETSQKVISNSK